jgi:type II secretory pathway component PulF
MKLDEFAFFNQQLAAMLRDGIPLEGALKRLCAEMRQGKLRDELQALEADLARGTPMAAALAPRELPELYKRMILVGVNGNDLPGALTMLADYFQNQNHVWTRLKSMMTYPVIVLMVALMISLVLSGAWVWVIGPAFKDIFAGIGMRMPGFTLFVLGTLDSIWAFPAAIFFILTTVLAAIFVPAIRDKVVCRLPAFKEATVSRIAASIHLLLKNGVTLPDAVGLAEQLESNPAAVADLRLWRKNLAAGLGKFSEVAAGNKLIPPMFTWLVSGAGENVADGFKRAAEIYHARAIYRTEVALYSVLPLASLFLGAVVISQAMLVISMFLPMIAMLTNLSGG